MVKTASALLCPKPGFSCPQSVAYLFSCLLGVHSATQMSPCSNSINILPPLHFPPIPSISHPCPWIKAKSPALTCLQPCPSNLPPHYSFGQLSETCLAILLKCTPLSWEKSDSSIGILRFSCPSLCPFLQHHLWPFSTLSSLLQPSRDTVPLLPTPRAAYSALQPLLLCMDCAIFVCFLPLECEFHEDRDLIGLVLHFPTVPWTVPGT